MACLSTNFTWSILEYLDPNINLNNLVTHFSGKKKIAKLTKNKLQSNYFSKMVLHNSRNKTRVSV